MAAADKLNGAYWRKRAIELAEKQKQAEEEGRRLADSADGMTKRYLTLRDLQGRKR